MRIIIEGTQEEVTEALRRLSAPVDTEDAPSQNVVTEPLTWPPTLPTVVEPLPTVVTWDGVPDQWSGTQTIVTAEPAHRKVEPLSFTMAGAMGVK